MIVVILIGIIIGLTVDLIDTKKRLNLSQKKQYNYCPNCGEKLNNIPNKTVVVNNNNSNNYSTIVNIPKNNVKYTPKELKNNIILITGASLIILSALIFLGSSWNYTTNLLKSIIIILMTLIFIIVNKIAKKFNLQSTSKTFLYLALIYFPISLVSLSILNLLGDFFSISGAGKNIYLALSFFITSIVYIIIEKKNNEIFSYILSVTSEVITIIFLVRIFTNDIFVMITYLIIYNIVNAMLYNNNILKGKKVKITISILSYILISLLFIINIPYTFTGNINIFVILSYITLIIDLLYINTLDKNTIFNWLFPLLVILLFYNIGNVNIFDFNIIHKQLFIICSIILIYIYDLIKNKKILLSTFIEISFTTMMVYFSSLIYSDMCIKSYIILYLYSILILINYIYFDSSKKVLAYLLTSFIFISTLDLLYNIEQSYLYLYTLSLLSISIPIINTKINNDLKQSFKIIGLISIILSSIISSYNFMYIFISLLALVIYYFYTTKVNTQYKFILYFILNILLFKIMSYINTNWIIFTIPITTTLISLITIYNKKYNDKYNKIYLLISYIISILLLNTHLTSFKVVLIILLNIIFVYYILKNKLNKNYLLMPIFSVIPTIYISNILYINNLNIMYFISYLIIIIYTYLGSIKEENKIFTISAYMYMLLHILNIEVSKYIAVIILLSITIYNFIKQKRLKDLYLFITYTLSIILYYFIIHDLNLESIALLKYGILILYILIVCKTILNKYMKNTKIIEYISYSLINLIAIINIGSVSNGLLYTSFLVILTIISYIRKNGALFITSIIFILINSILLTRKFWLAIPWWAYILIIGIILIIFAINNEKNNRNSIKNKIYEFKQKFK